MIGFLDFIYKLGLGAALGIVAAQYIGDIDGLGDFGDILFNVEHFVFCKALS
ncbi:MAG: hypothetical protein IPP23_11500 [Sphingomonadales bacterium]|nr:hypothetical protein [Sphingomonadales bacterium]